MPILYDAIVAFLCCAGIVATFFAIFEPAFRGREGTTCIIVSENSSDINCYINSLKSIFEDLIVVTHLDYKHIENKRIKVISPEEFEVYVAGNDKN